MLDAEPDNTAPVQEGLRNTLRTLIGLSTARERRTLVWVVLLSLAVALLQAFSVASIMPFMGLVANPGLVDEVGWIGRAYESLGFSTPTAFIAFIGASVLVILAVTNTLSAIATWATFRFVWDQHQRLSVELLRNYLHRPYRFFLNQNTSEMAKKLLQEVQLVTDGAVMQFVILIADTGVIVGILGLLLYIDWQLSLLIMGTLGAAYLGMFMLVRRTQARLGRERTRANSERFRFAGEALTGIKNVIILGRQEAFVQRFSRPSRVYSDTIRNGYLVGMMPRFAMETLAFGGIVVIVLLLLGRGGTTDALIAQVGLYAFAGYKLLPSLQHAFHAVTRLQFYGPVVQELAADLSGDAARAAAATIAGAGQAQGSEELPADWGSFSVHDLWFTYPGAEGPALRGVNLTIERNSWVAFVGTTGSGKTTVVDVMLGLLEAEKGSLRLDDQELAGAAHLAWRRRCAYVPQEIFLIDDSIGGNIAFGIPPEERDPDAIERAARAANLEELVGSLNEGLDTGTGEAGVRLSGGQRQRIGIARALYDSPDVLFFDEATSALDSVTEEAVLGAIRSMAGVRTVVMIAHRISTVRGCDQIFLMEGGEIIARGSYEELLASEPSFAALADEASPSSLPSPDGSAD